MKSKIVLVGSCLILIVVLIWTLSAGNSSSLLPKYDGITHITVNSLPEGNDYFFSGDDVNIIVKYLSDITLIPVSKKPEEFCGNVWIVSLHYENGDITEVRHMGNMFIKADNGPLYEMEYDEANGFELLLDELTTKQNQTNY